MKYAFFFLAILFVCCRPEPESVELIDQLVVSTNYDNEINFTSYSTYAIPTDTLGFVSNNSNDTIIVASESNYPRPVLQKINAELSTRGFSKVAKTANPDLGVNVLVANDFNVFQSAYYPSGYGGYYSGYYGYNSWYSYPYIQTYVQNTGVLVIEIVDLKNRTPDNKVRVIWTAYLGDVYSTLDLQQQTQDGIQQAFTQSPYLSK